MTLGPQFGQPQQLKMFMSPRELLASIDYMGDDSGTDPTLEAITKSPVMKGKIAGANKAGLTKRIAADGVKKPLDVSHNQFGAYLANGHHRLAVQASLDPDKLMPIMHHDSEHEIATADWTDRYDDPTGDRPHGGYR